MNNEIGLNMQEILADITERTRQAVQKGTQVQRLVMQIPGITDARNSIQALADSTPIIMFQDYYYRVADKVLSSGRNESSPMALPIIALSLHGSSITVNLSTGCWNNQLIDQITIMRTNERNGEVSAVYTSTYAAIQAVIMSEFLVDEEWYTIFIGTAQEVAKMHLDDDGAGNQGQVVANRSFITGTTPA